MILLHDFDLLALASVYMDDCNTWHLIDYRGYSWLGSVLGHRKYTRINDWGPKDVPRYGWFGFLRLMQSDDDNMILIDGVYHKPYRTFTKMYSRVK